MTDMHDREAVNAQYRRPVGELLYLAAPTVAQSVSYTAMQFIDTWMLSRLGTDAPTAAGNAGMFAFSVICFGFGVLLVVNTLVSQSYGRGQFDHCGQYLWQGIWAGMVYSLLVLPLIPLGPTVFATFGHSPHLAELEGEYLQIVLSATVVKMIGAAAGQFLLATNRPNTVLISAIIGVSINTIMAMGLVLGFFAMPRLGVAGAAWAHNAGVTTEMLILLAFVFGSQRMRFNVLDWRPRWKHALTLVRVGFGSGIQLVVDVLAWTMFSILVMAHLGEDAMAATQFIFRYMVVSFMPAVGIGTAVTALVGRYIGMNRPEQAAHRAHLGFVLAGGYMLLCGILMVVFRRPLMMVFTHDPQVVELGSILLIFAGVYQIFDAMYVVYNGALRGAGDTFIPAVVTAVLCWGMTVFGGYMVARYYPSLGVAGPWFACTAYGIALGLFMVGRFHRGTWRTIRLEQSADSNVSEDSARLSTFTDT